MVSSKLALYVTLHTWSVTAKVNASTQQAKGADIMVFFDSILDFDGNGKVDDLERIVGFSAASTMLDMEDEESYQEDLSFAPDDDDDEDY